MHDRKDWQALQARFAAARAAADRGDRETALAEITAALELDPNFLAAQALRDRLAAEAAAPAAAALTPAAEPPAPASPPPGVSADGYARFQQRTKRRRIEKRIEAAREAITRGRVNDAASALDEVIELDPQLPELLALTEAVDSLRRATQAHRGPWLAAAAVFACTILGGTWLQDSSSLMSSPVMTASLLAPVAVPSVSVSMDVTAVGTAGEPDAIETPAATPEVAAELPVPARTTQAPSDPALNTPLTVVQTPPRPAPADGARVVQPSELDAQPLRAAALREPDVIPVDRHLTESMAEKLVLAPAAVDDSTLVRKALQRYRLAYDELDAQSAQAVWPAVNQAALARAFDGLQSQKLTFDACDVRVSDQGATATCQGSARYVPKIGSREPRVEPRVWNFTLRKSGSDWKIDTARAGR